MGKSGKKNKNRTGSKKGNGVDDKQKPGLIRRIIEFFNPEQEEPKTSPRKRRRHRKKPRKSHKAGQLSTQAGQRTAIDPVKQEQDRLKTNAINRTIKYQNRTRLVPPVKKTLATHVTKRSIKRKKRVARRLLRKAHPLEKLAKELLNNNKATLTIKVIFDAKEVYVCAKNVVDKASDLSELIKVQPDGTLWPIVEKYAALVELILSMKELFDSLVALAKDVTRLGTMP